MITVVIGSETWRRKHGWVFSLSCLSLSFFGLLFNQLDWSTCFSKLSQRCNIHFAEVKSTVHTLLDSVVYKWFCVDLKVVGIFYLGAFLITNGSCVMMPIMSVVQQGGCNPSCRLMLEQQRIYTTGFCLWWFAVSHTTYLCLFAGLWSCCPFKWVVWVPWSGWFCPLLSHLLAWLLFFSCLLPTEPRLQVEWCRYEKSPSTLARHAKPSICLLGSPLLTSSSSYSLHTTTTSPGSLRTGSISC